MRILRWFEPILLLALLATGASAQSQKVEFSSDMRLLSSSGDTQTAKMYVGSARARIERGEAADNKTEIRALVIDFDHQFIYLLAPRSKLYLRVAGSLGSPFYDAASMFRPRSADAVCGGWVTQADRRGITLRCNLAGDETLDGRTTRKWDATASNGATGSLWYDPELNFIVKVVRKSPSGVQSGYELQNIKKGAQPPGLFETTGYSEFTLPKLLDVLTGVGQW